MSSETSVLLTISLVGVFIGSLLVFVGISSSPPKETKEITEPVKLEEPQLPNKTLINNALSKHEPKLFNYCKNFAEEMKKEGQGHVVSTWYEQNYGVTNKEDVSYIHITCEAEITRQAGLFYYTHDFYTSQTNKIKFKQVHDENNRLVHLIRVN